MNKTGGANLKNQALNACYFKANGRFLYFAKYRISTTG